jgi:hypothetical protein
LRRTLHRINRLRTILAYQYHYPTVAKRKLASPDRLSATAPTEEAERVTDLFDVSREAAIVAAVKSNNARLTNRSSRKGL